MVEKQQEYSPPPPVPAEVTSIYPPLVLMTISGVMILWSLQYGNTARLLPMGVAGVVFFLAVLDLSSRFNTRFAEFLRFFLGAGFTEPEMTSHPKGSAELKQILWLIACLISFMLVGILPTIPFFTFLYMFFSGEQSLASSTTTAIAVVVVIGLVFELLLGYELYRGFVMGYFLI